MAKKQRGLKIVIVVLVVALAAVVGLILWKQWEYGSSAEFYSGLRSMLPGAGEGLC